MRLFRKILGIVMIVVFIISIIYVVMNFTDILAILPLDKLKVFFAGMIEFIIRTFGRIIDWFKNIIK